MLQRSDVVADGIRTVVAQSGPTEDDEAIVFVHGNPGFSRDWEDLMQRAAPFARCVAPDMPGFGRSDKPETFDYTVDGYARQLGALLTQLKVRKAHLVLHDFGGPWGLAWALSNPSAAASLTLINTGLLPGYRWHLFARLWRTPIVGEAFMATTTRAGFHIMIQRGNPRGLPKPFVDAMFDCLDSGTKRAVLRLYRATSNPGEMSDKFGKAFRHWNCPVLVIWGRADPYIPSSYAERQREFFPSAKVVVMERSGHWPYADDPQQVASVAVPFWRSALSKTVMTSV
jgi:pimeloyl-ACP methyl ester carboxylesterase